MGKKSTLQSPPLAPQELLRRASRKLQRHLFRTHAAHLHHLIELAHPHIAHPTYERCKDLLRQTKREARPPPQPGRCQSDQDSQDLRIEIRKKERLPTEFSEMLDRSVPSYQRTSVILKKVSLRQKYAHLLGQVQEEQQQKRDCETSALQQGQQAALLSIKSLYRRYRVSNMFKENVCSKIRRIYVDRLIKKGLLRQHNRILTLAC